MPAISVIIPVFNVEKYLGNALESLMYQTFKDIEIICVDDGSTDCSGEICERFARTDRRISVIRQENQGAGGARNTGMAAATGKYIAFMDGDDWLHPNFLEVLYCLCEDNGCEIAQCGFDMVWSEEGIREAEHCDAVIVTGTDMAYRNFLPHDGWRNILVPNKLFRRECLEKLKFPCGKWHEDEYFTYKAFWHAARIAVTECPLYYYRQHSESTMGTGFAVDKMTDKIEALEGKEAFFKEKDGELYVLANRELEFHLKHYLGAIQKHLPEREDIKTWLQEKLKVVSSVIKMPDSESMGKKEWNQLRLNRMQDGVFQHFVLNKQYNRSSIFKPGIVKEKSETKNPKVSVCIPVYNVGACLGNCLESVINQSVKDIEIICVDDGSSDNSLAVLEAYADGDSRIRIIRHGKNLGTLVSRKDAVMAARGKYIMFADGDDELFPNACETAFRLIDRNHTDVAEFGVLALDPSGREKQLRYLAIQDIDRLEDRNLLYLRMKRRLKNWQIWNKIYSSDLLKKAFGEIENAYSVLADDFRLFCVFGYYARSIAMTRETLYKWKWGSGIWSGIRQTIDLNRYKKLLTEKDDLDAVIRFIESKPDKEEYQGFLKETREHFLHQTITWWHDGLEEKEKNEGYRLFAEKWGCEDTAKALRWLLRGLKRDSITAGQKLLQLQNENRELQKAKEVLQNDNKKLQQEKGDLLKRKAELEIIKESNGYKLLRKYYKIRNWF